MPALDEAIVLAGGLGTRLRSAVAQTPKPIASVAGRPFLAWLLDHLEQSGVRRAILSVGYGGDAVQAAIGRRHGRMTVDYVKEDEPLGTGGALRRSLSDVRGPAAFAFNGDTLFLVDLSVMAATARRCAGQLVVALRSVEAADRYGTCVLDGETIVSFEASRPQGRALINGGVYVLPRTLFDGFELPARFSFEIDFMERHVGALKPQAIVSEGAFIDIGIPESYEAAQTLVPKWMKS